MHSLWLDPVLFPLACLGGGGALLALAIGLGPARRTRAVALQTAVAVVCLTAAVGAVLAYRGGQTLTIWGPPAALAALYLLLVVAPAPLTGALLASGAAGLRSAPGRRAVSVALVAGCPFLALGLADLGFEPPNEMTDAQFAALAAQEGHLKAEPLPYSPLTTDRGRPVAAHHLVGRRTESLCLDLYEPQDRLLESTGLRAEAIHLPLGWQDCNCHGFVFTGGQFWIDGNDVDAILADNAYQATPRPRLHDVAVYRDASGKVTHTGVVRGFASGDVVLIESKWGKLGRFLHRHDRHPYASDACTFYHSPRPGHLLRGASPSSLATYPVPEFLPAHVPVSVKKLPSL